MTFSGPVSWHAPSPPDAESIELAMVVEAFPTGWQNELLRLPVVKTQSIALADGPVAVISVPLRSDRPATTSYSFAPPDDSFARATASTRSEDSSPPPSMSKKTVNKPPASVTRLQPPGDIIKLRDRLFYVLQPPIEMCLGQESLPLPCQPFAYQYEGIAFLYTRFAAILADEMGLGKTMQAITAIRLLLHAGELRNVALICPKPLVANWQREFAWWAPEIPVTVIEGDQTRRQWLWQLPDAPVKIANYELLVRDREVFQESTLHFDLVVLDESQRIKNRSSSTAQIARSIPRRRSWALTGTPIENSQEDLVGIFEFLSPGYLSSQMKPRRMGRLASEFVLRRTKDKVLSDLPPKLFRDAELSLTGAQRESYRLAEEEGMFRLNDLGEHVTIHHVFELVVRLKQICNFDPATGASVKFERLAADLEEVVQSNRKAIVFSQWVGSLRELKKRLADYAPLEFHGKIPNSQRQSVLRTFAEDPNRHVILMSYGAGGVGLNLQFANYVFLFDRWWNPAVEDQAINRAHRIGTTGPVTVTRFLALNTIEERIDQVLREKRELFDTIFSDTTPTSTKGLSRDDIFGLFKLHVRKEPDRDAA